MSTPLPPRIDRRTALKWVLTAAASTALIERGLPSALAATPATGAAITPVSANGYCTDPDLVRDYKPGDVWPLTLTDEQRRTAAALCELILPAEGNSPGAAAAGVHDFIDEWISAPYPTQRADRIAILAGFAWLETEAQRRFNRRFAAGGKRMRRIGIVALARRLAIALWRYLQHGEIPAGATLKPATA